MLDSYLRRLATLGVIGAVALFGAGCSSSDSGGSDTGATGTNGGSKKCDDSDKVKFGAYYHLTGPAADIGTLARDGAVMAADDVNASGGVLGKCIELIVKDDAGDPTKAAQVARELVDQEEVAVVLGPVLSSPTSAGLEVTNPAKIIHIVQGALTAAADPQQFPYAFTNENNSKQIQEGAAAFMKRQGLKKAGIIAVNNAYGIQGLELFNAAIKGTDISIAGKAQFFESGTPDLNAEVGAVVDAGADVILIFNVAGPDQNATIKARNQLAPKLPMIGASSLLNGTADHFTAAQLETVYAGPSYTRLAHKAGTTEPIGNGVSDFLAKYKKFKGVDKVEVSLTQVLGGYDGLMATAAAVNGSGSTESDAIKKWFESNSYDGVRAKLTWSATSHAGVSPDQTSYMKSTALVDGLSELAPGEG